MSHYSLSILSIDNSVFKHIYIDTQNKLYHLPVSEHYTALCDHHLNTDTTKAIISHTNRWRICYNDNRTILYVDTKRHFII